MFPVTCDQTTLPTSTPTPHINEPTSQEHFASDWIVVKDTLNDDIEWNTDLDLLSRV